jgi:hypothetical protein
VKNDGRSFRQRDVATRQAYLWAGFFVFGAVFFLVVFLTGGPPLGKPVDLLSLGMCVVLALSWLSYATGGLGQDNRRARGRSLVSKSLDTSERLSPAGGEGG